MSANQDNNVVMYYSPFCGYCTMAARLLKGKNVDYQGINVVENPEKRQEMLAIANGQHTVPQIFINGTHVGGYTDMAALEQSGELDKLLGSA